MDVQWFTFEPKKGRGEYHVAIVKAGGHHIEITASPTGRSVHVYVDRKRLNISSAHREPTEGGDQ